MEPFYFTPFGTKRLQTAPEAAGEAVPNGALESVSIKFKKFDQLYRISINIYDIK